MGNSTSKHKASTLASILIGAWLPVSVVWLVSSDAQIDRLKQKLSTSHVQVLACTSQQDGLELRLALTGHELTVLQEDYHLVTSQRDEALERAKELEVVNTGLHEVHMRDVERNAQSEAEITQLKDQLGIANQQLSDFSQGLEAVISFAKEVGRSAGMLKQGNETLREETARTAFEVFLNAGTETICPGKLNRKETKATYSPECRSRAEERLEDYWEDFRFCVVNQFSTPYVTTFDSATSMPSQATRIVGDANFYYVSCDRTLRDRDG